MFTFSFKAPANILMSNVLDPVAGIPEYSVRVCKLERA